VAGALAYLHGRSQRIVVRDLTSANVVLDAGGAVLCDFGLAAFLSGDDKFMSSPTVALRWMAPEVRGFAAAAAAASDFDPGQVYECKPYDQRVDVFAFGLLLHELVLEALPLAHLSAADAAREHAHGHHSPLPPGVSPAFAALAARCIAVDADQRPSAAELVEVLAAMPSLYDNEALASGALTEIGVAADAQDAAAVAAGVVADAAAAASVGE
jgi:serine/threonine protein kinase